MLLLPSTLLSARSFMQHHTGLPAAASPIPSSSEPVADHRARAAEPVSTQEMRVLTRGHQGNFSSSLCRSQRREQWERSHPLNHLPWIKNERFLSCLRAAGKVELAARASSSPHTPAAARSSFFLRKCENWREQLQAGLAKHKKFALRNTENFNSRILEGG